MSLLDSLTKRERLTFTFNGIASGTGQEYAIVLVKNIKKNKHFFFFIFLKVLMYLDFLLTSTMTTHEQKCIILYY